MAKIQGVRADWIVFDDYIQEKDMASEMHVSGADLPEVRRAILRDNERGANWITIDPEMEFNHYMETRSRPKGYPPFTSPTERFRINWRDGNESFSRVVNSVKELNQVLKPIFQRQILAKRLVEKDLAKSAAEKKAAQIKELQQRVQIARRTAEQLEAQLDDLRAS